MQFKVLSTLALATHAAAIVAPARRTHALPSTQCNVGDLQCCNSVQSASSASVSLLLSFLGIPGNVTGLVGINCSPIFFIAVGDSSCSAQPVCCSNNSFNGLVALGCTPVDLNL